MPTGVYVQCNSASMCCSFKNYMLSSILWLSKSIFEMQTVSMLRISMICLLLIFILAGNSFACSEYSVMVLKPDR